MLPWRWSDCNNAILYSQEDLLSSVLHVYEELLETGERVGSAEGIGEEAWIGRVRSLELPWSWSDCHGAILYSQEDLLSLVLHVYEELLETGEGTGGRRGGRRAR